MIQRIENKRRRRMAFTLMEMLIVVAIIVALAGIGVVSYFALFADSQKDVAAIKIKGLSTACDAYRLRNGSLPASLQDLYPKYIEDPDALKDPWGKAYTYDAGGGNNGGRHADISTIAPDGTVIGNWPKNR
jgi:general secretion pathway protein G